MVTRVTKQITLTNESATEKMRGALLFFCIFSLLLHVSQCERQTQGVCEGMRCQPTHRLTANPKHVPTSNGCGNAFFKVSNEFNFTPCCDSHDICYDTCGNKKDVCDREFTTCLANYCKTHPNAVNLLPFNPSNSEY